MQVDQEIQQHSFRYFNFSSVAYSTNMPLKTCMPALLRILFIFGFGGIFTLVQKSQVEWDFLVFTQIWPQTACTEINETQGDGKCFMPAGVKEWTIHGLWPSQQGTKGPSYCNDSWPFRPDEIKDIQPVLEKQWPNLIVGEAVSSFWKHEWTKHGTCGTSLPALNSEHNYFAQALQLQQRFNLTKILSAAGIHPSLTSSTTLDDIHTAIQSHTKFFVRILCMETKAKTEQLLAQVEICIDKNFRSIACDKSKYGGFVQPVNPKFTRLKRSTSNADWDPYPYFPQFMDCKDDLPIKYFPIQPSPLKK